MYEQNENINRVVETKKKKNQIIELNNTINGKIFSLNGLNGRLDQAEERIS